MEDKQNNVDKLLTHSTDHKERLIGFIKIIVAKFYGEKSDVYFLKSRRREVIRIKHNAIYFCMKNTKSTYQEVANAFGMNHATALYVCRKTAGHLEWDHGMRKEFDEIQSVITDKGLAQANNVDLNRDFYFIDLNKATSIKIDKEKAIVFTGWTENEIERFKNLFFLGVPDLQQIEHNNTNLYILETLNHEKP